MNLESHHSGRFLQPKVIPLLLLIHEWGKDGQKALIRTDAIVLLLESLHLMLSKKTKKVDNSNVLPRVYCIFRN